MDQIIRLPSLTSYQQQIVDALNDNKITTILLKKGRQCGGSFLNKVLCTKWLLEPNIKIMYVTPTNKLARNFYDEMVKRFPNKFIQQKNGTDLYIKSTLNSELQFFSSESGNSIRGFQCDYMLLDEAAYINTELYQDVLLGCMFVRGKKLIMTSTPAGESGFFWSTYIDKTVNDNPNIFVVETNINENPFVSEEKKNDIKLMVSQKTYNQEYLALFLKNGNGLFEYSKSLIPEVLEKTNNYKCVAGIDLGKKDKTVMSILNLAGNMVGLFEWSDMSYTTMIDELLIKLKEYNVEKVVIEKNSIGDVVIDMMANKIHNGCEIIDFFTSNKSKNEIMEELMVAFEQNKIKIFNNKKLLNQLDGMSVEFNEKTRLQSFLNKRTSDGHSDYVMALAFSNRAFNELTNKSNYQIKFIR